MDCPTPVLGSTIPEIIRTTFDLNQKNKGIDSPIKVCKPVRFCGSDHHGRAIVPLMAQPRTPVPPISPPIPSGSDPLPTPRQLDVLYAIHRWCESKGYAPSRKELCDMLGMASANAIAFHVANLEALRLLTRQRGSARTLQVTPLGLTFVARHEAQGVDQVPALGA